MNSLKKSTFYRLTELQIDQVQLCSLEKIRRAFSFVSHQWFVDVYLGGEEELEGRELVFQCDFPEDERIDATYDFGFLTTRIQLNELNEIVYMEYVWVPWA